MTSLGVACFSQTSWLVDKKRITCFVTAFSFVFGVVSGVWVWRYFWSLWDMRFSRRPISSTPLSWEFFSMSGFWYPVFICLVSSPSEELLSDIYLFWRVVMWQLIITINNTAIRQGSLMLHALWALEIQKWMSESLSSEVCYLLKLWVLLQKCQNLMLEL